MKFYTTTLFVLAFSIAVSQVLPTWKKGFLDIHHINTGSGNSTFVIFPDGTTLLIDAGDTQRNQNAKNTLKTAPQFPADSVTAAECITLYIKKLLPAIQHLDYALITHFHGDHFGTISLNSKTSTKGNYKLSGITEVDEYLPITNLFDRNYPRYDFPLDILKNNYDSTSFKNYLQFIRSESEVRKLKVASIIPGSSIQLVPVLDQKLFPEFKIRNLAANGKVWSGKGESSVSIVPNHIEKKDFNENPLSIALKITYGDFDYFTGGDLTGLQGFGLPTWFDMETPLSKVVGKVEALSLNHHGVRDATNEAFLKATDPQVIVQQSWSSNHPGEEVLHRIISPFLSRSKRDIFATYVHPETIVTYGRWLADNYKAIEGHIAIRVSPGGKEFFVHVIDDRTIDLKIKQTFGPYSASK